MSVPKLYSAPGERGEAEVIRLMFKEFDMKFEEVPVEADKLNSVGLIFGSLPMVDFGDVKLVTIGAILEHIAVLGDKAGTALVKGNAYLGRNEEERAVARALATAAGKLLFSTLDYARNKDTNADIKKQYADVFVPTWFAYLDKLAVASIKGDKGLGPGVDFTFGDLAMFEAVNAVTTQLNKTVLRKFPNLKQWHDDAIARPAVEKHMNSRADAKF